MSAHRQVTDLEPWRVRYAVIGDGDSEVERPVLESFDRYRDALRSDSERRTGVDAVIAVIATICLSCGLSADARWCDDHGTRTEDVSTMSGLELLGVDRPSVFGTRADLSTKDPELRS